MSRSSRSLIAWVVAALMLSTLFAGSAVARSKMVIRESFSGTARELPKPWKDVDGDWRRVDGVAKIVPLSVSTRTNIAYSIRSMKSAYAKRGLSVSTRLRLSPTHSNVGVVGPYKDVGNHLFCKVEKTPVHPNGFLAIGRRLHGTKPAIRVKEDDLGLTAARRYALTMVRDRSAFTCTITRKDTVYGSLDYTLTKPERRAFGSGKKTGIRMRLVARGTRRDEDDGRSAFDTFRVRTLS
jgi:hypothetical protein